MFSIEYFKKHTVLGRKEIAYVRRKKSYNCR
jgi:hypothetical protein